MNSSSSGTVKCLGAAVLFGLVPSFLKFLMLNNVSQPVCIIVPNGISLALCGILSWARGRSCLTQQGNVWLLLLSGALGIGITPLLLTGAYQLIPIGRAIVLHFLYPTVVTLLSILFFKKKASPSVFCAAFLSFTGVAFLSLDSGALSGGTFAGVLLALASAFSYALFILGSERLQRNCDSTLTALFFMNLGSLLTGLIWALCGHSLAFPASARLWLVSIGHGLVEMAGYFLLSQGIRSVGAVTASFATLLEPLTAVLFGAVFFRESVSLASAAGIVMVLSAVWLNITSPVRSMSKLMLWMIIMNTAAGQKYGYPGLVKEFNPKVSSFIMRKRARPLSFH